MVFAQDGAREGRVPAPLGLLADAVDEVLLVVRGDGTIEYANRAAADLRAGCPPGTIGDLVVAADADRLAREILPLVRTAGGWSGGLTLLTGEGERPTAATAAALPAPDGSLRAVALVLRDDTEQRALVRSIAHEALHDPRTRLANRALFLDRVAQTAARLRRRGGLAALAVFDVDDLHAVNDLLGHGGGHQVLSAVARRLRRGLRETDTPARLSGDQFAAMLDEVADLETARDVVRRLLDDFRRPLRVDGHEVGVTLSAGIAVTTGEHDTAETLLVEAEAALADAKRAGKDRYRVFDAASHERSRRRSERRAALAGALDRDELFLEYQPMVDLATGRIQGVEALVRWRHPTDGVLGPGAFVPLAEETGQIVAVGRWVLEQACRDMAALRDAFPAEADLHVSVNLSALQLRDPSLPATVARTLEATGLPAAALVLELTESSLIDDPEGALATLQTLRGLGLRLALDDFGTGYSSLSYLQRLPVELVKIDRSFVTELSSSRRESLLARGILQLTAVLELTTIAEGIESPLQLRALRQLGCRYGQGYLFARPVSLEAVAGMLTRQGARKAPPPPRPPQPPQPHGDDDAPVVLTGVATDEARAWAQSIATLRREIAIGKERGDLAPELAAPNHIHRVLKHITDAVAAMGPGRDDLRLCARRELQEFIDYQDAMLGWVALLVAAGQLTYARDLDGERFYARLRAAAYRDPATLR